MLPRWHIFWGLVFSFIIWAAYPRTPIFYLLLVFFASFLIDFDHYIASVMDTKTWNLAKSFEYHKQKGREQKAEKKRGIYRKGNFHLFHTLEFHLFIGILSFVWAGFFYIFIGMVFHSLLDLGYLMYYGYLYRREYFLFNWLGKFI